MEFKKYILVITEHQEKETLFCRMMELLKEDFKIVYANGTAETLGLLKMIKPALTLINHITLKSNIETMSVLRNLIATRFRTPVLLYGAEVYRVLYVQNEENHPNVCTAENISLTIHELKAFIDYRRSSSKATKGE